MSNTFRVLVVENMQSWHPFSGDLTLKLNISIILANSPWPQNPRLSSVIFGFPLSVSHFTFWWQNRNVIKKNWLYLFLYRKGKCSCQVLDHCQQPDHFGELSFQNVHRNVLPVPQSKWRHVYNKHISPPHCMPLGLFMQDHIQINYLQSTVFKHLNR